MNSLRFMIDAFSEDVNNENSAIIKAFGRTTDLLFLMIKWLGFPFVLYVLLEFVSLG